MGYKSVRWGEVGYSEENGSRIKNEGVCVRGGEESEEEVKEGDA